MPKTIPRSEQDKELLDKIEEELSGVLNWALEGYDRLMEQGEFTADRDPSDTEEMWQKWSSSAKRFLHECIEVTGNRDGDTIDKGVTMKVFEEYVERRGMPSASQQTMTKTITSDNEVTHSSYGGSTGSGEYEGVHLTELGNELLNVVVDGEHADESRIQELLQ
jgi:phage/plasmid-associated DNA primase